MTTLVKIEAIVATVSFPLIFVCGIAGHLAIQAGADPKLAQPAVYAAIFLFFCLFGFSCIGLMVHVFTAAQIGMGNGAAPMIQFLAKHEMGITFAFWGFLGVGTLIAAPFALYDSGFRLPLWSKGTMVGRVGMTLAEVKRRSTIPWREPTHMGDGSYMVVEDMVFEFRLDGSALRFPYSRYYWIQTPRNDTHISVLRIGITPRKVPKGELDAFQHSIQQQLLSDGWMPGHYVADSEETVHMWGGQRTTQDGRYWLKNGGVLIFERKRMDDEQPGEPADAGEYIVDIQMEPKADVRDVVFEPSAWRPEP